MSELVVSCKNIQKIYGKGKSEVRALRGVNLQIFENELFMIAGPSGSGKNDTYLHYIHPSESNRWRMYGFGK